MKVFCSVSVDVVIEVPRGAGAAFPEALETADIVARATGAARKVLAASLSGNGIEIRPIAIAEVANAGRPSLSVQVTKIEIDPAKDV